jgi:hypothetical protein
MPNEQTSVPLFVANTVLTASQQNLSAGTGVPVFASTTTRNAAFGGSNKVLAEGQLCYLSDSNIVQYYDGAAWATVGPATSKIAQVVQATYATATASSSTSYVTSGLSASITPTLNTSKILVMVTMPARTENSTGGIYCTLFRGTVAGTNFFGAPGFGSVYTSASNDTQAGLSVNYLDSPATTSATTYTVGFKSTAGQNAVCQVGGATSSITLIEVLA